MENYIQPEKTHQGEFCSAGKCGSSLQKGDMSRVGVCYSGFHSHAVISFVNAHN